MPSGRRVVVLTGANGSLSDLADLLSVEGLTLEETPLLTFEPPADWAPLDTALRQIERFAAVAVTSPRAADALVRRARIMGIDTSLVPAVWSGPGSVSVLRGAFATVHSPPNTPGEPASLALVLATAMLHAGVGSPVLFPCGESHREELPALLTAAGRRVEQVVCYRAVLASPALATAALARANIIVATSPRVARLLASVRRSDCQASLVAIGPTTAEAATAAGWVPETIADEPTTVAVARAIKQLLIANC
jgi:uroporphyrinogen-III synthase